MHINAYLDRENKTEFLYYRGLSHFKLGQFELAEQDFSLIVSNAPEVVNFYYYDAFLWLGLAAYSQRKDGKYASEKWQEAITKINSLSVEGKTNVFEVLVQANIYLAELTEKKEAASAYNRLDIFSGMGSFEQNVCIDIELLSYGDNQQNEEKIKCIREALRSNNDLDIRKFSDIDYLKITPNHLIDYFSKSFKQNEAGCVNEDLEIVMSARWEDESDKIDFIPSISEELTRNKRSSNAKFFYRYYLENRVKHGIARDFYIKGAINYLLEFSDNSWEFEIGIAFYDSFTKQNPSSRYTSLDFIILYRTCSFLYAMNEFERILTLCTPIIVQSSSKILENKLDITYALFWCLRASIKLDHGSQIIFYANEISRIYFENQDLFAQNEIFTDIYRLANQYSSSTSSIQVSRPNRVSVRYKNGKIKRDVRYKVVEKDIKQGKCYII
ncbi:MAG: hypothetical protein EOO20_07415 [Chryseobacterium sp.]|nr:MAG: hypothetical protein EOO20_07415 [Chryseobacterium sp.]